MLATMLTSFAKDCGNRNDLLAAQTCRPQPFHGHTPDDQAGFNFYENLTRCFPELASDSLSFKLTHISSKRSSTNAYHFQFSPSPKKNSLHGCFRAVTNLISHQATITLKNAKPSWLCSVWTTRECSRISLDDQSTHQSKARDHQ